MLRRIFKQRRSVVQDEHEDDSSDSESDEEDVFEWSVLRHNGPWFESTERSLDRSQVISMYRKVPECYRNNTFWKNFEMDAGEYGITRRDLTKHTDEPAPQSTPSQPKLRHDVCIIDGREEKITNWKMEPPCVFIGRGDNPYRGCLRQRVTPEDVTLNLDERAQVPKMNWGAVVHRHDCGWLWSWKDPLLGKIKYVYPSFHSRMHAKRERKKFDEVYILKDHIWDIRRYYEEALKRGKDLELSCIIYLIDHLGLRIGSSDTSDVDGASTLKVGCIQILDGKRVVRIRFRGKDSIEYDNQIMCDYYFVDAIRKLSHGKRSWDFLFPNTSSQDINNFLSKYHPSIKSKTFRTFNATMRFKEMINASKPSSEQEAVNLFKKCVTEVAIFCNHKRISSMKKIKYEQYTPTTSITNYIDPRVVIEWAQRNHVPLNKIYTKSLMERFSWAM